VIKISGTNFTDFTQFSVANDNHPKRKCGAAKIYHEKKVGNNLFRSKALKSFSPRVS
jgi:hypothetical protein